MFNTTMKHSKVFLAAALSGSLMVGGSVAFAADGPDATPDLAPVESGQAVALEARKVTAAVPDVAPAIKQDFRLFREQAAQRMPAEIAAQIGSPSRYGRNPQLARKIKTVTGDGWVIPGNGWICIAMPDPVDSYGTSCLPTDVASEKGLYVGLSGGAGIPAGKSAQVALLPDEAAKAQAARSTADTTASPGVVTGFVDAGDTIVSEGGR